MAASDEETLKKLMTVMMPQMLQMLASMKQAKQEDVEEIDAADSDEAWTPKPHAAATPNQVSTTRGKVHATRGRMTRSKGKGKGKDNKFSPVATPKQENKVLRRKGKGKGKGKDIKVSPVATPKQENKVLRKVAKSTSAKKGTRRKHVPADEDYQELKDALRVPIMVIFDAAFCAVKPGTHTKVWGPKGFCEETFSDYALPIIDEVIGSDASKETVRWSSIKLVFFCKNETFIFLKIKVLYLEQ